MMPEFDDKCKTSEFLAQTATRCYLSTLLAATDSMTEACPEIGMSFKRRWSRAPYRIGFDPSAVAIEETCRTFEQDLQAFASYAGTYFRPAVPLVNRIVGKGAEVVDSVLDRVGTYSVLLETLAESLAVTADLDAPPAVRDALDHQAAGLANCARRIDTELLPLIGELKGIFREGERLLQLARASAIADPETGLLNSEGLARELERRLADGSFGCVVVLNVGMSTRARGECSDEEFREIATHMSDAVFEQFRANESIGLVGRKFVVLFGGSPAQAEGRKQQIELRLAGVYPLHDEKVKVTVTVEINGPVLPLMEISQREPALSPV